MAGCDICKSIPHKTRCPNYVDRNAHHILCSICGEPIYKDEQYITNDDKETAHLDCLSDKEIVEFLGYEVLIADSSDYEDMYESDYYELF